MGYLEKILLKFRNKRNNSVEKYRNSIHRFKYYYHTSDRSLNYLGLELSTVISTSDLDSMLDISRMYIPHRYDESLLQDICDEANINIRNVDVFISKERKFKHIMFIYDYTSLKWLVPNLTEKTRTYPNLNRNCDGLIAPLFYDDYFYLRGIYLKRCDYSSDSILYRTLLYRGIKYRNILYLPCVNFDNRYVVEINLSRNKKDLKFIRLDNLFEKLKKRDKELYNISIEDMIGLNFNPRYKRV